MASFFRVLGAIAAGLALAFALVVAVEAFCSAVHPPPLGFTGNMEETCKLVENCPSWLLAFGAAAWGCTAFVSTWVTRRLGNLVAGIFVGVLLLASVIFNMSMLPYLIWFEIANLIVIPAAILLALLGIGWRKTAIANAPSDR